MADNTGKTCKVHYTGTLNNGEKFDSSRNCGQTLDFTCGAGQIIPGFNAAVKENIVTFQLADNPGAEEYEVGQQIYLNAGGRPVPCKVTEKIEETITIDANHELAGKELNFNIELVSVE